MQRRLLPRVPLGVNIESLSDNLRLYSRSEIEARALRVDGRLLGVYEGDPSLLANQLNHNEKLVQDLQSGEWLILRTLAAASTANAEDFMDEPVSRAHEPQQILLHWDDGISLAHWLDPKRHVSLVNKIDLAIALVKAVKRIHDDGIVHGAIVANHFKVLRRGEGFHAALVNAAKSVEAVHEDEFSRDVEQLGLLLTGLWRNDPKLVHISLPMLHADVEVRPTLAVVLQNLEQLRAKLATVEKRTKIASLHLDQFRLVRLDGGGAYRALISHLKGFDEIRLVDDTLYVTDKELLAMRADLEAQGILVSDEVVTVPNAGVVAVEELIPDDEVYNIPSCVLGFFCDVLQDIRRCCTRALGDEGRPLTGSPMLLFAASDQPGDIVINMSSDSEEYSLRSTNP